jgi:hypothetical protein
MQTPGPPVQSESGPHATHVFEDWLQIGVFTVPPQSLLLTQTTHVPLLALPVGTFKQTGTFAFLVAHAVAPAASHPSQAPVSRLQIGVWGVVHWVSMRQPTHIPFIKVAVAVVTQTGFVGSFVVHAVAPAASHPWQVPVDGLQMGAWGVVQSLFARQLTHIPAVEPASPGTQSGLFESSFWQALESTHFSQLLAAMLQMGVLAGQRVSAHEKGVPPVPLAPAAPPAPPEPAVASAPPSVLFMQ